MSTNGCNKHNATRRSLLLHLLDSKLSCEEGANDLCVSAKECRRIARLLIR